MMLAMTLAYNLAYPNPNQKFRTLGIVVAGRYHRTVVDICSKRPDYMTAELKDDD